MAHHSFSDLLRPKSRGTPVEPFLTSSVSWLLSPLCHFCYFIHHCILIIYWHNLTLPSVLSRMKIRTVPHSSLFLQHLVQIYAGHTEGAQLMSKLRERMNEENLSLSCLPFLYITCKPFLEKKSFLTLCLTAATNKVLCTCRCSINVGSLFRWLIIPQHPRDKHMKEGRPEYSYIEYHMS